MLIIQFPYKHVCVVLLLVCFSIFQARSQTFTISTTTAGTTITANSTGILESGTSNNSGIAFSINSAAKAYNLSASVTSQTFAPTTTTFGTNPFDLQLNNISTVSTTGQITTAVNIPPAPSTGVLATSATKTSNKTAVWTYNLILRPIGYLIAPGNYQFVVTVKYDDGTNIINRPFNLTLIVSPTLNLAMTAKTTASYTYNSVNSLTTGFTWAPLNEFAIKSNIAWQCTAAAQTANFRFNGANVTQDAMPSSVLKIYTSYLGAYTDLSTANLPIYSGVPGNFASTNYPMSLKAVPGFTYLPGVYDISLMYTLTAQ